MHKKKKKYKYPFTNKLTLWWVWGDWQKLHCLLCVMEGPRFCSWEPGHHLEPDFEDSQVLCLGYCKGMKTCIIIYTFIHISIHAFTLISRVIHQWPNLPSQYSVFYLPFVLLSSFIYLLYISLIKNKTNETTWLQKIQNWPMWLSSSTYLWKCFVSQPSNMSVINIGFICSQCIMLDSLNPPESLLCKALWGSVKIVVWNKILPNFGNSTPDLHPIVIFLYQGFCP